MPFITWHFITNTEVNFLPTTKNLSHCMFFIILRVNPTIKKFYEKNRMNLLRIFSYEKAAVLGHVDAQYALGVHYEDGNVPVNIERAVFWYFFFR